MAGVFQGLEGTTATFGQVIVLGRLVVSHNPTATAANILGHEALFWLGFASCIVGVICHIVWALLMYDLFRPVNRRINLLAACVILVGCAVQALTILLYLAPLLVLKSGGSLSAFPPDQLQALAYAFLRLNAYAFDLYIVFFGLWCVLIGFLIFHSAFLPRVLGILLAISGLGWMTYIYPPLAEHLFVPYLAGASAMGEFPLLLWLLIAGVNGRRWREQAAAAEG
jgi:hypothetical protein